MMMMVMMMLVAMLPIMMSALLLHLVTFGSIAIPRSFEGSELLRILGPNLREDGRHLDTHPAKLSGDPFQLVIKTTNIHLRHGHHWLAWTKTI